MTERDAEQRGQRVEAPGPARPAAQPGPARPPARAGKRAEPTEPEVPSAKRMRAIRRQRSLLLVGGAIMALACVALYLLFMAGQHVTTLSAAPSASSASGVAAATVAPLEPPPSVNEFRTSPIASDVKSSGASTAPSALPASGSSAPRTKSTAPSKDIFRKPAF
jgi:hypothetical protein